MHRPDQPPECPKQIPADAEGEETRQCHCGERCRSSAHHLGVGPGFDGAYAHTQRRAVGKPPTGRRDGEFRGLCRRGFCSFAFGFDLREFGGGCVGTGPPPASGYFSQAEAQKLIASGAVSDEIIPAPDPPSSGSGGASASSILERVVKPYKICAKMSCGYWWVEMKNPSYHYKRNANGRATSYWQTGTHLHSEAWYPWYYWPELTAESCGNGFTGPSQVWGGEQKHLTIWARFKITAIGFTFDGDTFDLIIDWLCRSGYGQMAFSRGRRGSGR